MKLIAIILTAFPLLAQLPMPGGSTGGGGGSGTVEAITATCGLNTADGAAITISGSIKGSRIVNAQTGTSYAIQNSDCGKLLTVSNGAAIALSIAQAGTGGFDAGWYLTIRNLGAGTATITPATSTINGAATLAVVSGRSAEIYSDGTNYQVAGASAFAEADVARLSTTQTLTGAKTFSAPVLFSDGTSSAPAMTFASDATQGFFKATNGFGFRGGTGYRVYMGGTNAVNGVQVTATGIFAWATSGSDPSGALDTNISRCSAGVICAGTGDDGETDGTFRGLFQSSDGTAGATGTCTGAPVVKNGLVVSCTGI